MARKKNEEFLRSLSPSKFSKYTFEDMLLEIFKSKEPTIVDCAYTAYNDLRRMPLAGISRMPKQEKNAFRTDVAELISCCIEDLFKKKLKTQDTFDVWHNEVCEKIRKVSTEKHNVIQWLNNVDRFTYGNAQFTYGNAQMWLNMTIKNIIVTEQRDKDIEPIKKYLHIPINNNIKEVAFSKGYICANIRNTAWSKLEYSKYIEFQREIRRRIKCPIDWELDEWLNR